ncbi:hypothetical protein [Streptomyces sp. NPDC057889]|uniref:hypothetical protein n=1 Tax=unclassified Streptomyces TaxID=2593676 RepID=UPI00368B6808
MTDVDMCAREGCSFLPEIVLIGDAPLPAVYCGDACADFEWLRRALEMAAPSPSVAEALQDLNALERLLNGRVEPMSVGPLLGSLYGR